MSDSEIMLAADGRPLKESLHRSMRQKKLRALALIAPLLVFILLSFIIPIFNMLTRSVHDDTVAVDLPRTVQVIGSWSYEEGGAPPDEETFKAMAYDIKDAFAAKQHMILARRLNYEEPGLTSVFRKSGSKLGRADLEEVENYTELLTGIDKTWAKPEIWAVIKNYKGEYTSGYYVAAVDGKIEYDGSFSFEPKDQRIHQKLFVRTIWLSFVITCCTILLGYPVAWLLAHVKDKTANLLMILVLLPFWTSLLVRTSAWKVLLQKEGVINQILKAFHIIKDGGELDMMYNQFAVVLSMTHILLPFMILPLYSVMKTVPPSYLRAAKSMGATNWTAFWRVYFPQTVPGIGAGAILVFILAVGYFITPEIMGGADGTFISNRIYHQFKVIGNWGLAAALGSLMLFAVLALYWVYDKIVGIDNVKLG